MPFIEEEISSTADEYGHILRIYSVLESAGMTMNPPVTQLNTLFVNDSEHKVEFTATYKGATLKFRRGRTNNSTVSAYEILTDGHIFNNELLLPLSVTANIDTVISRNTYFRIAVNDDALFIRTASSRNEINKYTALFLFYTENNEDRILCNKDGDSWYSLMKDNTFYQIGDETYQIYKPARMLQYGTVNFAIDTVDGLAMGGNANGENTIKELYINSSLIKSCSLVPASSVLTIGDKQYYSVTADCIMEI